VKFTSETGDIDERICYNCLKSWEEKEEEKYAKREK